MSVEKRGYRKPGDPTPPGEIEIDPQRPITPPVARWAAFTDAELHEIRAALDMLWQEHRKIADAQRVWDEITAEFERRQS